MPFYSLPSGASPILAGTEPPTGGIGQDGDLFLDTAGKTLYGPKSSGSWPSGIDLSNGPTGSVGATGPTVTGPTGVGVTGPTGFYAFEAGPTAPTAPPMDTAGAVWLDTDTGKYFVRYDDAYIEIGVQGEQGPTGAASTVTGPTGAASTVTGPTGGVAFSATGPTAPTGAPMDSAGAVWLDTDTGKYFVRYGDVFVEIGVQGEAGPTGATGPVGQGLTWKGSWSSATTYYPYDVVEYSGSSYICKLQAAGVVQGPYIPTYWDRLTSVGPQGVTGPASTVTGPTGSVGPTGPTGANGAASTVTGPTGPSSDRGLNAQSITGNLTLTSAAAAWQIINPEANALTITLPTGIGAGFDVRVINSDNLNFYYFDVKTPGDVTLASLYFGSGGWFVWDGGQWRSFYLYNL